jgi:hypothetical protein
MRQSVGCNEHFACSCYRDEIARLEAELKELWSRLRTSHSETAVNLRALSVKKAGTRMKAPRE